MGTLKPSDNISKLNDTWLRLAGIPVIAVASQWLFYEADYQKYQYSRIKAIIAAIIITTLIWELNRISIIYFRKKFPNVNQTKNRTLFTVTSIVIINFLLQLVLTPVYNILFIWNHLLTFNESLFDYGVSLFFILFLYIIYEMIYFFRKWNQSIEEKHHFQEQILKNQLDLLKNQVNPHFLFNSLNTLEALIDENSMNASRYVSELATVYRFILQSQDKELNTVKEEINFINAYTFLLTTRFGNNITVEIEILPDIEEKQLPALSLQLLVENAMKHNIVSATKPLKIEIFSNNETLYVRNNLQRRHQFLPSTKTGLENIKKRYQLLGDYQILIEENTNEFIVGLPLLSIS